MSLYGTRVDHGFLRCGLLATLVTPVIQKGLRMRMTHRDIDLSAVDERTPPFPDLVGQDGTAFASLTRTGARPVPPMRNTAVYTALSTIIR